MEQEAWDFYRFVLALGRHKSSLLHPEVSSDQGDGVGEGRAGLVIPRRGARSHATLLTDQGIRRQRVTTLNQPKSAGVVRAMARSDHWRWVSMPR